jgi:hypothetical protein
MPTETEAEAEEPDTIRTLPELRRSAKPLITRATHKGWKVFGSLVAVVALGMGLMQVVVALGHRTYTVDREFDASGLRSLEVHNGADGTIRIVGAETDKVTVKARVSDGIRHTGHSERVDGDRLILDSTCPTVGSSFCEVKYTVEVPRALNVLARVDSGSISVTDVDGDVDVRSDSNGVELARIGGTIRVSSDSSSVTGTDLRAGNVDASSDSGHVFIDFARAPDHVVAKSDSSGVEVVVPDDDTTYNVEPTSDSGDVVVEVPTDPSSSRTIVISSDSSDVVVRRSGS